MYKSFMMLLVTLALVGCAAVSPNPLTPEQLKAINSDKNITVVCNKVDTLTTDVTNIYAIIDKSTISSGSINVNNDCSIQVISLPKEVK